MRKPCGFTLVELVITIAVAAVLMAIAAPSFNSLLAGWRLSSVTNELIAAVHLTRSEAVRLNRTASLCSAADAATGACAGGAVGDLWQHWIVSNGNVARRASPSNSAAIEVTSSFAANTITFGPDGLPRGNGTLTVCSTAVAADNLRVVSVGPGNRVSVARQTGNCP